ncbi:DUF707 domain-containing protein [Mucilaginibacter paludis]|uniref:DUF707 domain-containing protein n=1 Tax=Mucilaginibacter paludis DSM 18603 TaxID=714943 RepID=H1Y577_9SPHI|nr:hypothetical protein [Mucilaginibacter paludis]EHQ28620.1 hypothetical protein Mucpa_4530 [Mucilaginibacter paludis DSM 18603]
MRKNIIIAPCGNSLSTFKDHWLKDADLRNFDVCLLFYHQNIDYPSLYADVDYFFHLKDFKYKMIHQLLTEIKPGLLDQYEYFYFIDDDVVIDTLSINKMFDIVRAFDLWIGQASLTSDSYCSWPILKHNSDCFIRFIGQVEVMAPVLSRFAVKQCLSTFTINNSSWGMDSVWSKLLDYPTDKIAVVDAIQMRHINPVGGGELYKKINENPHQAWDSAVKDFDAIKNSFTEYGRLLIVNNKKNRVLRTLNRLSEKKNKLKQAYLDYGLSYRIKNRLGIKI